MKNRSILEKLGDLVLGKGFYIVLFLCVATIGISGYYLIRTMGAGPEEPAGGGTSTVLPDSEANGPEPAAGLPGRAPAAPAVREPDAPDAGPVPEQPDDPEPVSRASATVTDVPAPEPEELPAAFVWPVEGEQTRLFCLDTLEPDPTMGDWRTHSGLDIAAPAGTSVLAMAPGTVSQVYDDGMMGTTVMVEHGGGLTTVYCGLAAGPAVEAGDRVEMGEAIGEVGQTAIAESSQEDHLHLETWLDGQPADPADYLPAQ